jgi:hypothetical protein
MVARVTTIQLDPSRIDVHGPPTRGGELAKLKQVAGFKGFTLLVDRSSGKCLGTSYWELPRGPGSGGAIRQRDPAARGRDRRRDGGTGGRQVRGGAGHDGIVPLLVSEPARQGGGWATDSHADAAEHFPV